MQIKVACLKHCTREQVSSTVPPAEFFLKKGHGRCGCLACRGWDGACCGFVATQLHYTKKKAGVVTATYYKKLCKRCNDGKRPASRSPSPQRRPPVQRATNCFGGDASAVSHRPVGRGHGLHSLWLCEALHRLLELYEILHAVQASRLPTKAQQVPLP